MEPPKNTGLAYALAVAGFVTPFAGLHRFYLGRPMSGVLYVLTWGLFGVGTLVDLFRLPKMVAQENVALSPGDDVAALPASVTMKHLKPDQQILRVANESEGVVTVTTVAAKTALSLREAQKHLERMHDDGFCMTDVSDQGAKLYIFHGMRSLEPFGTDE